MLLAIPHDEEAPVPIFITLTKDSVDLWGHHVSQKRQSSGLL